jgi:type IV pilus assembly protein PilC
MITYIYTAKNAQTGQKVKAEVQAESEQMAAKLLLQQQLVPITITQKDKPSKLLAGLTGRVKTKEIVIFTRQLATLINAGLPLTQSLRTVREQITNKTLLVAINQIINDVEGGSTLANAFAKHPRQFNEIFVNLIKAGEASGSLDTSLERIANQQEKDAAITSKIRGALIYPAIVLFVIGAVIIFMFTTVIPQIEQLYADLDADLPLITRMLIAISGFIINFWWLIIIGIVGGIIGLHRFSKTPQGRSLFDHFKMKVPIFGKLFMKLYMARFCRTSSILMSSGLSILEVMRIVQGAVNNVHVAESLKKASEKVKSGKALSLVLSNDPYFLSLVPQMIKIGEQSGTLSDMLGRCADYYEDEIDNAVKNLSTTIEPLLMIVLGVSVGGIVAAILVPVYGLISVAGP